MRSVAPCLNGSPVPHRRVASVAYTACLISTKAYDLSRLRFAEAAGAMGEWKTPDSSGLA